MERMMETTLQSLFSFPPRNFGSNSSPSLRLWRKQSATAEKSQVRQILAPQPVGEKDLVGTIFSYRHDWGELSGNWNLFLDWDAINARSCVFVSIAEGSAGGPNVGKFIGEAKSSLFDVAPADGRIAMRVHIDGETPIRLYADYLVINASEGG
jgi:hypothetical protein